MAKAKDKNWIQKAIKPKKKGTLRKTAGVKAGEKIPAKTLNKLAKKKGVTGKRARLAKTLRKLQLYTAQIKKNFFSVSDAVTGVTGATITARGA